MQKITEQRNYLPGAVVDDDDGRDWMMPIPAPPIAPASRPNKINTGMLSSNEFFFAISELLPEIVTVCLYFSIPFAVPSDDATTFRVNEIQDIASTGAERKCKILHLLGGQNMLNVGSHMPTKALESSTPDRPSP